MVVVKLNGLRRILVLFDGWKGDDVEEQEVKT
jgi:hypothetical protein